MSNTPDSLAIVRTLRLSNDTFDHAAKFGLEVKGFRGPKTIMVSLQRDKVREGDGIYWALKGATSVQASYSDDERAVIERVHHREEPLRNGDHVRIEGDDRTFCVKVTGDYMDAAIFEPVNV